MRKVRLGRVWLCVAALPAAADEGLWPYNQFPTDIVNQKHSFAVTPDFLDHLRLSSVRLSPQATPGSGSFVSAKGLILTNQHLIETCVPDAQAGFYAAEQSAERKCAGLDASVLLGIEDVTNQVKSAQAKGAALALEQRNATIAGIEKECTTKNGGRCQVVKLFFGGSYDLYRYKVYSDLRLVFAAEKQLAFFGRERDSLTYLRYGLDIAFLRAYENGQPAATPQYLKWSAAGVKEDDLVFAAGNPAPTNRVATAEQLQFYRDTALPVTVARLQSRIQRVGVFASQSADKLRVAESLLSAFLTSYKLAAGKLIGLRDDRLVARKTAFQGKVRRAVTHDSKLGNDAGKVWDDVAAAYKTWAPFEKPYQILETSPAPGSVLFRNARQSVRHETPDPRPEVNNDLEVLLLTEYLEELKNLGDKEVPVKNILAGKTPAQTAADLVKSPEAMAHFAQLLEEPAKRLHKKHHDVIESLEASAAEKIALYRFKLFGTADYPDATGTPRVEFGVVKAYTDRAGVPMPYAATFGGLYFRENNRGPYQVPQRWVDLKDALNQVTPLDFVSTCDIGGGEYGSPVVNRSGELVGMTFDGNLESLPDNFLYTEEQARAVHVAAQGILESLAKVYKASRLLEELVPPGL